MSDPSVPPDNARSAWRHAAAVDELWEDEIVRVRVGDVDLLLVRLRGNEVHAYDNRCPHAGSPLSDGSLNGTTLRCIAHFWEFDVRTGEGVNPRNCSLRRFSVRIVNGHVMVRVDP